MVYKTAKMVLSWTNRLKGDKWLTSRINGLMDYKWSQLLTIQIGRTALTQVQYMPLFLLKSSHNNYNYQRATH